MTTVSAAAGLTRLRTDQVACLQTIRARASGDVQGAAEQLSLWILQEHLMACPRGEGEPSALGVQRDIDAELALWGAQLGEQEARVA
eukprot:66574-Lingulodinium_polyedra.AAC.1